MPALNIEDAIWEASDLDASLASGAVIPTWVEKGGLYTGTSSGSPTLVKNQLNGKSVVRLGSGKYFNTTLDLPTDDSWTYMAVVVPSSVTTGNETIVGPGGNNNSGPTQWLINTGHLWVNAQNQTNNIRGERQDTTLVVGQPYVLTTRYVVGSRYRRAWVNRTFDMSLVQAAAACTSGSRRYRWIAANPTVGDPTILTVEPLDPATVVTSYTLMGAPSSFVSRAPKDFKLQGSNDLSAWTDLDTRTGITNWTQGTPQTFAVTGAAAYRFYRLVTTATMSDSSNSEIWEFQLNAIPARSGHWEIRVNGATSAAAAIDPDYFHSYGPAKACIGAGYNFGDNFPGDLAYVRITRGELDLATIVASEAALLAAYGITPAPKAGCQLTLNRVERSSDAGGPWRAQNLFEGQVGDNNVSWTAGAVVPQWVEVDVLTGAVLTSYTMQVRASDNTTYPKDFKLQGSNDAGATWTDLDTQTGLTWTASQSRTFPITNTTTWKRIRLYISTSGAAGGWPGLTELFLRGTVAVAAGGGGSTTFAADIKLFGVVYKAGDAVPGAWPDRLLRSLTRRGRVMPAAPTIRKNAKIDGTSYAAGAAWSGSVTGAALRRLLRGKIIK